LAQNLPTSSSETLELTPSSLKIDNIFILVAVKKA
jgi:hypothetical protein